MLNYRYGHPANPMSAWGHAMFCNRDEHKARVLEGVEAGRVAGYTVDSADLVDINDLRDVILAAWAAEEEKPYYLADLTSDEFFAMFDPTDIVDGAEAWDNDYLVPWFWNRIAEPMEIKGVQLTDGAIAFDASIIARIIL